MKELEDFEKNFISVPTLGDYSIAFIQGPRWICIRDECFLHQAELAGPRLPAVWWGQAGS